MIRYASTRGDAPELGFADALLTGLATDGGLYCPTEIPSLPSVPDDAGYAEIATAVMWPYVDGSFPFDEYASIVAEAYAGFRHPDVAPVRSLGDDLHLLELFWGPTLAFKDVALQLLGRLLDAELARRGERITVVGATSGDTGSAAIEALRDRSNIDVVILHPEGRVSEIQRRQMTTVEADNVANVAVRGTFDDCQDLVKAAFGSGDLRDELGLAAVNSINWARVMAQIVYYVTAARAVAPDGRPVTFCVPTGNFGNVLAGWYAKRMGLAVDRLVVASNRNDILTRFFETGRLEARSVEPSLSPSMDIQISSNFERALWEASGRDGRAVAELIARFRREGSAEVPAQWVTALRSEFDAGRADDDGTLGEMAGLRRRAEITADPHTAVGLAVARAVHRPGVPTIALATAHPAKFPDAVEQGVGERPSLPPFLAELPTRPERYVTVDAELDDVVEVARALRSR